jgi:hypothetical protein
MIDRNEPVYDKVMIYCRPELVSKCLWNVVLNIHAHTKFVNLI